MRTVFERIFTLDVQGKFLLTTLQRKLKTGTLVVKVNGKPLSSGWRYDSTDNAIIFSESAIPAPGASIEVNYQAVCVP